MKMRKLLTLLVLGLLAIDQLTKWAASTYLPFHETVNVIPFFSLYLTHNTGVAFSMLAWLGSVGISLLTLVIIGAMFYFWRKLPQEQQLSSIGFAMIIAGALGNLIDRITQGHVVDFFLFHTQTWAFAVFNAADSFITLGAICIIVDELFSKRNTTKSQS